MLRVHSRAEPQKKKLQKKKTINECDPINKSKATDIRQSYTYTSVNQWEPTKMK